MRVMAIEEAMASLLELDEGCVKYLADTLKRLLSLGAGEGGLTKWNRDISRRRRKEEATTIVKMSLPCHSIS